MLQASLEIIGNHPVGYGFGYVESFFSNLWYGIRGLGEGINSVFCSPLVITIIAGLAGFVAWLVFFCGIGLEFGGFVVLAPIAAGSLLNPLYRSEIVIFFWLSDHVDSTKAYGRKVAVVTGLSQKLAGGLLWSILGNWGARLATLVLFMVLTQLLSPAEVGLFASALVVMNFLSLFVEQGLGEALVQRKSLTDSQKSTAFFINFAFSLFVFALLWIGGGYYADFVGNGELRNVLRVGGLSVVAGAFCVVQQALFKRELNYRWLAVVALAATLTSGIVAVGLAWCGYGVWALVAQNLLLIVFTSALLWWKSPWRPVARVNLSEVRPLLGYGASRLGGAVLDFVCTRGIELFLVSVAGPAALGMYSVGVRLHQALMQVLSGVILDVAHNGFSRLQSDKEALRLAYCRSVELSASVVAPIFIFIFFYSKDLVVLLFGEKWTESSGVLAAMSVLGVVQVMQFYNGTVLNAVGRPSLSLLIISVRAAASSLSLVLSAGRSLNQIVTFLVVSQILTAPFSFFIARYFVGFSVGGIIKSVVRLFLIGGGVAFGSVFFRDFVFRGDSGRFGFLFFIFGGLLVYFLMIFLFDRGLRAAANQGFLAFRR